MDEPSVLDFVISKIKFWQKSKLHLPPAEARHLYTDEIKDSEITEKNYDESDGQLSSPAARLDRLIGRTQVKVVPEETGADLAQVSEAPQVDVIQQGSIRKIPWLTVIALLLSLIAQRSLEPSSDRGWTTAVIGYSAVAILLIAAYFRKEWNLPELKRNEYTSPFSNPGKPDCLVHRHPPGSNNLPGIRRRNV